MPDIFIFVAGMFVGIVVFMLGVHWYKTEGSQK